MDDTRGVCEILNGIVIGGLENDEPIVTGISFVTITDADPLFSWHVTDRDAAGMARSPLDASMGIDDMPLAVNMASVCDAFSYPGDEISINGEGTSTDSRDLRRFDTSTVSSGFLNMIS